MKRLFLSMLALAVVTSPAVAQKITIDYAHDFDFGAVKKFTYVSTEDTKIGNDLADARLRSAIVRELTEGGLEQVETGADIYITYHVATQDNTVFNTTHFGYSGYGPGWGAWPGYGWGWGGGMGTSSTTATTYTEGTLIIDAYEPGDKKLVWRGTGTVTLKSSPEKQAKQIDKILKKMGNKWDKILVNQGKK